MADFYGEEELKERCENLFEGLVTEESVCEVYSVAIQYDSRVIQRLIRAA